jgi:hypothetical protein
MEGELIQKPQFTPMEIASKAMKGCIFFFSLASFPIQIRRVFKNRLEYDLKSNQIICQKYDLKSQSNRRFPI